MCISHKTVSAFETLLLWLFAAYGGSEVETTEHCRLGMALTTVSVSETRGGRGGEIEEEEEESVAEKRIFFSFLFRYG